MRISGILQSKGSDVITIGPHAPVTSLVALLREYNLGAVVVSSDTTTLIGIVSERDVIRHLADGPQVLSAEVSSLMTTDVHTCTVNDTVDSLMSVMTEHRVRHVPVVDEEGLLAGIVSIGDVVKSRLGELEFERDQLEGYVSGV